MTPTLTRRLSAAGVLLATLALPATLSRSTSYPRS
jgi:hypothetical protein